MFDLKPHIEDSFPPIGSVAISRRGTAVSLTVENASQLTFKALVAGCVVGTLGSFLTLYYGLKLGVIPSLNILSGILGFVLIKVFLAALHQITGHTGTFTRQENAVVQTTAGAVLSTAFATGWTTSYLAMTHQTCVVTGLSQDNCADSIYPTFLRGLLWTVSLGFFGVFISFPLREYNIIKERLFFPSGTCTAIVIDTMHSCSIKAKYYFSILAKFFCISFVINMFTWTFQGMTDFPIFGVGAGKYGWGFDFDIGTVGLGTLLDLNTLASIVFGGVVSHAIINPVLDATVDGPVSQGYWYDSKTLATPYLGGKGYSLLSGIALLVVSAVLTIIFLLYTFIKECFVTFRNKKVKVDEETLDSTTETSPLNITGIDPEDVKRLDDIFRATKVPEWISPIGYLVAGLLCILVCHFAFHTPWYQVLVALLLIPVFTVANIEAIARTDWDVSSVYGKLALFPFGFWNHGGSVLPSLVISTVTVAGSSNAGQLTQDFKTGWMLGASPGSMFIAQIVGQIFSCFITPALFLLLSTAYAIPSADPNAFIPGVYGPLYRILAVIITKSGIHSFPKNIGSFVLGFAILGIIFGVLRIAVPERYAKFIPDIMPMAIGMVVPAGPSVSFLFSFIVKAFWNYKEPTASREKLPYVSSGALTGSGIAVVVQCIVSLVKLSGPMSVDFSKTAIQWKVETIVLGCIAVAITFAVITCGGYYWFPPESPTNDLNDGKSSNTMVSSLPVVIINKPTDSDDATPHSSDDTKLNEAGTTAL